jgi:hypothetical protein
MRGHAFPDQDIIEDSLLEEEIVIVRIGGAEPAPKIVGIDDLAIPGFGPFALGDLAANERMQAAYADPGAALVVVMVIVADVEKEVSIIKDTDSSQSAVAGRHLQKSKV